MTKEEAQKVPHGLFVIRWKEDGGESLASVGSNSEGHRWFAPTNWINVPWFDWDDVESVERIQVTRHSTFR